jgi:hypothetical protein
VITSVELTPAGFNLSGSGVLKAGREPVIVLQGVTRADASHLSCAVASFHAGLEPGVYEMSDGTRITVPSALVDEKHAHHTHVTLEVQP